MKVVIVRNGLAMKCALCGKVDWLRKDKHGRFFFHCRWCHCTIFMSGKSYRKLLKAIKKAEVYDERSQESKVG